MVQLFDPLTLRDITLRNRIGVPPMCQYSAENGFVTDWHFAHYGARAVGGAGLIIMEATAVEPRGRISPQDLGIWSDDHVEPLARIAEFMRSYGAAPAIQIAHAGRKAGTAQPWKGGLPLSDEDGGWTLEESVELSRRLKDLHVDLIDCSSGGGSPAAVIHAGPGFQVPFATAIRRQAGIPTATVGMITQPMQAAQIIGNGEADIVLIGREMLRDAYWPLHAAGALGVSQQSLSPHQYERAF